MPIKIPSNLPAKEILEKENIFVMTEQRAYRQDIRPLQIAILNLMPTKIQTETQLTRLLGNTPLQVELTLVQTSSYSAKNTSQEHMISFYKSFNEIRGRFFDGFIITGAPVEHLEFEEVEYWDELCTIMEWTKTHVHSTFHICWGAQAALYYHFGIKKYPLKKKLFGVFKHTINYNNPILFRGFDDEFYVPHSRHTGIRLEDVLSEPRLKLFSTSDEAGVYAMATDKGKQIFITGHSEYDRDTLKLEYLRDLSQGKEIDVHQNYFPEDNPEFIPMMRWKSCANLLYSNWLNYFVYQTTPFDIQTIKDNKATPLEKFMDRADYRTMIPMLEKLEKEGIDYDSFCADSGYDIKDNYEWLEKHGKKAYIKPQYHEEDRKRKRRKNPSLKSNFAYDEESDAFTCMRGHKLYHVHDTSRGQVYEARRGCKSCPLRKQCMLSTADKYDYKRLAIDIEAERYRRKSEALITSYEGIEVRINRSIQAEGSFSLLKSAFGCRRFRMHGIRNIEAEWMILCMAGNALRYSIRLANGRAGTPFWFRIEQQAS